MTTFWTFNSICTMLIVDNICAIRLLVAACVSLFHLLVICRNLFRTGSRRCAAKIYLSWIYVYICMLVCVCVFVCVVVIVESSYLCRPHTTCSTHQMPMYIHMNFSIFLSLSLYLFFSITLPHSVTECVYLRALKLTLTNNVLRFYSLWCIKYIRFRREQ